MAVVNRSREDIFWTNVDQSAGPDACWPWLRSRNHRGYGITFDPDQYGGRHGPRQAASRTAWRLTNGPIPDGLFVLHSCDNPPCCNPTHLVLGTHADNMRDKVLRGRVWRPSGELHPLAKLTRGKAETIREHAAMGLPRWAIADEFGVSTSTIDAVVNGLRWL